MKNYFKYYIKTGIRCRVLAVFIFCTLVTPFAFAYSLNPDSITTNAQKNSSQSRIMVLSLDSLAYSLDKKYIQIQSELQVTRERIEDTKKLNKQMFLFFTVFATIGTIIGSLIAFETWWRERQHRKEIQQERINYKEFVQLYHNQLNDSASNHVKTLNDVMVAFKKIMDFKIEEAEKALKLVEEMKNQYELVKTERNQNIEELRKLAMMLHWRRFEYTNPELSNDPTRQNKILTFRIKMNPLLAEKYMEYITCQTNKKHYWEYGVVFWQRGVIAYFDKEIKDAEDLLYTAEKILPPISEGAKQISSEQRFATAGIQFHLALLHKSFGDIYKAKDHIEKSSAVLGQERDKDLHTQIIHSEILFYLDDHIVEAEKKFKEIIATGEKYREEHFREKNNPERNHGKKKKRSFDIRDSMCLARANLILGNINYVKGEWQKAQSYYREALKIDKEKKSSYYAHFSIAQTLFKESKEDEARKELKLAYDDLNQSKHLNTKPTLQTLILLNALAFLCLSEIDIDKATMHITQIQDLMEKFPQGRDLKIRLFSLKTKRLIDYDKFYTELLGKRGLI